MFPTILIALAAAGADAPGLPGWMAGCWVTEAQGRWTEECWSTPRGGMMIGYSRSGKDDRVSEFEMLRIALEHGDERQPGLMRYIAAPQGGNSTAFEFVRKPWPGVTFYNTLNEYPQRVRYWRDGDMLIAEIALVDGSKPRRWSYRKVKP